MPSKTRVEPQHMTALRVYLFGGIEAEEQVSGIMEAFADVLIERGFNRDSVEAIILAVPTDLPEAEDEAALVAHLNEVSTGLIVIPAQPDQEAPDAR